MSVCGKNPTAFPGTRKRQQRTGKSFKSFIYFLICRKLFRTAIEIFPAKNLTVLFLLKIISFVQALHYLEKVRYFHLLRI